MAAGDASIFQEPGLYGNVYQTDSGVATTTPPLVGESGTYVGSGGASVNNNSDTLSGIGSLLNGASSLFTNVWNAVNPPQYGQINPQTGIPYGINPTTGMVYGTTFGGNSGLLLIGGVIVVLALLFRK